MQITRWGGDGSSLDTSKGLWMKVRQRSAFPPNYIHSIDSTHMMMTALECAREGEWCGSSQGAKTPVTLALDIFHEA